VIDEKIIMSIVGIVGGLVAFLQKVLYGQGKANYAIIVKLIDRFNKSDETRDRRYEDLMKEVNEMSDKISYLSGRINSK